MEQEKRLNGSGYNLQLIGLYSPYSQAGKSEAAKFLHGGWRGYQVLSFATPIREMLAGMFNTINGHEFGDKILDASFYKEVKDTNELTKELGLDCRLRDLMISLGEGLKSVDSDIWVKVMKKRIEYIIAENLTKPRIRIVIDDLRFPNEMDFIKSVGGYCGKIINPFRPVVKAASEGLLGDREFDFIVENDKSKNIGIFFNNLDLAMIELGLYK